ncbi:MAG: thioredoxin [Planctomycetes bacterium]|nr:thioredoxin [Planctomycetota bacterium]
MIVNVRPWLPVLGLFLVGCSRGVQHVATSHDAIEVTDQSFQAEVLDSSQPVLVDFWAPWCGPCRMIGPVVEELATEHKGSAKVCKVNVDECPELSKKYAVQSIPLLLVFKSGEVKERFLGVQAKDTLQAALESAKK